MAHGTQRPKLPWFAGSAQRLANEHGQTTYIVTREDADCGADDAILFATEIEDADLPNILWAFEPSANRSET